MATATVNFIFERATKGAVRFQEVDAKGMHKDAYNGAVVGTLYIRKDNMPGIENCKTVTLEIKAE